MVSGHLFHCLNLRGGVGLVSLLLYFTGFFRKVHWNLMDGLVLLILIYSLVRLSFQEMIPHTTLIKLLFFGGLYFLGRMLFSQLNWKALNFPFAAVLLAGIGESLYGLGQLYGIWSSHHAAFPLTGSFFNPGPYSGWLALLIPMAVWVLSSKRNRSSSILRTTQVLSWSFLFLASGVLIVTMSRAAWFAATVGSMMVLWGPIRRFVSNHRKAMRWAILASVLMAGLLVWMYQFKKDSAQGRILIWKVSSEMVSNYPLFGVGRDRFPVMYSRYQSHYFSQEHNQGDEAYLADYVEYPFNEALGWTAEMGMVGLFLILVLIGIMVRMWQKKKNAGLLRPVHSLAASLIIAWIVFSMFSYPTEVPVLALSGILLFSALATNLSTPSDKTFLKKFSSVNGLMSILLIGSMAVYSLWWSYKNRPLAKLWIIANANYQIGHYGISNRIYTKEIGPVLENEGAFLKSAGKSLSMSRKFHRSAPYLERALYFTSDPMIFTTLGHDYALYARVEPEKCDRTELLLKMVKYMQPGHYFPRYMLMEMYERTEQQEKMEQEASDLLALETKIKSEAVDEMRLAAREVLDDSIYDIKIQSTTIKNNE